MTRSRRRPPGRALAGRAARRGEDRPATRTAPAAGALGVWALILRGSRGDAATPAHLNGYGGHRAIADSQGLRQPIGEPGPESADVRVFCLGSTSRGTSLARAEHRCGAYRARSAPEPSWIALVQQHPSPDASRGSRYDGAPRRCSLTDRPSPVAGIVRVLSATPNEVERPHRPGVSHIPQVLLLPLLDRRLRPRVRQQVRSQQGEPLYARSLRNRTPFSAQPTTWQTAFLSPRSPRVPVVPDSTDRGT
jgi:hypothetical protein